MRALDIALAAFALRVSPTRPQQHERRLAPAVDDAEAAMLNRAALAQEKAAIVASLWATGRCMVPVRFETLPAPAILGGFTRVKWSARPASEDARALQARVKAAFIPPRPQAKPQPEAAYAA
ncbi:MAG: hypothetical protein R3C16_02235 [Hyphomonadaceae bacterium]